MSALPQFFSAIQVLNPAHRLNISDLPKVPLSGRKLRMPHDHLADDLNRSAGSGGEGGRVPSQVMGTKMDSDQATGFSHHNPGRVVADRKKPLFRSGTGLLHILLETVSHLLRNENNFGLLATFGARQGDLPILNVHGPDFQDLADSHSTPGRQLQHDPVPRLHGSENDLIHQVLFDNLPLLGWTFTEHFAQHGRIARVQMPGSTEFLMKLKKALRQEYQWRLLAGLAAVESPVRKGMTSSVVMDSTCLSPNTSMNRVKMNS